MFKELDPLLHSQLRLAVVSLLMSIEEADFVFCHLPSLEMIIQNLLDNACKYTNLD